MKEKYSTRNLQIMLKNQWYKEYWEQKQEIVNRYPPQKERTREEHLQYMKEVGELLWKLDGPFQEYVWDTLPEQDKVIRERTARGKQRKRDQF